jgi:hypothetical protein
VKEKGELLAKEGKSRGKAGEGKTDDGGGRDWREEA